MWKIAVLLLTLHSCGINAGNIHRNGKYREKLQEFKNALCCEEAKEERKIQGFSL